MQLQKYIFSRQIFFVLLVLVFTSCLVIFYISKKEKSQNIYIANTVGNHLSEVNKLFLSLAQYKEEARKEQKKYNLDMLLIIDCSDFIKSIPKKEESSDIQYFVSGVQGAWDSLRKQNTSRQELLLCNGRILNYLDK